MVHLKSVLTTVTMILLIPSLAALFGYSIVSLIPKQLDLHQRYTEYCGTKHMIALDIHGDWFCVQGERL